MAITRPLISLPTLTDDNPLSHDDLHQIALIQKDTGRGGLWWSEVQSALQYLFNTVSSVFVPDATSLLGELHALPLKGLKARGIKFVAFSLVAASQRNHRNFQHQVAIWINMQADELSVHIYNSEGKNLNQQAIANLTILMGDMPFTRHFADSPYQEQSDIWSCGVFVVMHLLHAYLPAAIHSEKETLNVSDLVIPIFIAAERGKALVEKRQLSINSQVSSKHALYELIKTIKHEALNELISFMKFELNAATLVGGAVDHEYLRTRSLAKTLEAFKKTHPSERVGFGVLQAAYWASVHNAETMIEITTKVIAIFTKVELLKPFQIEKTGKHLDELDKLYSVILTTIELAEHPNYEWQQIFDHLIMLSEKSCVEMLAHIFTFFEDLAPYKPSSLFKDDAGRLVCHLLLNAIDRISGDEVTKLRLTADAAAREEQAQKNAEQRLPALKEILANISLTNIDEAACQKIARNPVLFYKVKKYLTPLYFAGCDDVVKNQIFHYMLANPELSLIDMINLYPGNETEKFYETQTDAVTNEQDALSIMGNIKLSANRVIFYHCFRWYFHPHKMAEVLPLLDEDDRLGVAKEFTSGNRFQEVIKFLPNKHHFILAAHHLSYPNGDSIEMVLKVFTVDEAKTFIATYEDKIAMRHVVPILGALPTSDRLFYAKKFKSLMNDRIILLAMNKLDSEKAKEEFLHQDPGLTLLLTLDLSARRDFIAKLVRCTQEQIKTISEFVNADSDIRFEYFKDRFYEFTKDAQAILMPCFMREIRKMLSCYHHIHERNSDERELSFAMLIVLLTNSLTSQRLAVALEFSHVASNATQVARVSMLLTSESDCVAFLKNHKMVQLVSVSEIIGCIPVDIRLNFAIKCRSLIATSMILCRVLAVLKPEERFALVQQCDCVAEVDCILEITPYLTHGSDMVDFTLKYCHLITQPHEFERLITCLTINNVTDMLRLFHKIKSTLKFSENLIATMLEKFNPAEGKQFFAACIDLEAVQHLQATSTVFAILFNRNPVDEIHYQYLITAMLYRKMNVTKGALIFFSATVYLDFENNHLPAFFKTITVENKQKLSKLLWPLVMLLEEHKIEIGDLAWLSSNDQPKRTDNLVIILQKMSELTNSNLLTLLGNQFSLVVLLDCPSAEHLGKVIDSANLIKRNDKIFRRAVLGLEVDDEQSKAAATEKLVQAEAVKQQGMTGLSMFSVFGQNKEQAYSMLQFRHSKKGVRSDKF